MQRTERRMRLCVTWLVLNLTFIWGNSLLPGEISGAISDWVKSILASFLPVTLDGGSDGFLVRKLAHFSEFAALGMGFTWLFAMLDKGLFPAFFCGTLAACVDETIQLFVPGRGPGIADVCIDAGGVLTGILLLSLLHRFCRKPNWRKRK